MTSFCLCKQEMTMNVIREGIYKHPNPNGIIIEGFPRTIQQVEQYEKFVRLSPTFSPSSREMSLSPLYSLSLDRPLRLVFRARLRGAPHAAAPPQARSGDGSRRRQHQGCCSPHQLLQRKDSRGNQALRRQGKSSCGTLPLKPSNVDTFLCIIYEVLNAFLHRLTVIGTLTKSSTTAPLSSIIFSIPTEMHQVL